VFPNEKLKLMQACLFLCQTLLTDNHTICFQIAGWQISVKNISNQFIIQSVKNSFE